MFAQALNIIIMLFMMVLTTGIVGIVLYSRYATGVKRVASVVLFIIIILINILGLGVATGVCL